jgi:hypothetical protein
MAFADIGIAFVQQGAVGPVDDDATATTTMDNEHARGTENAPPRTLLSSRT